MKTRLTNNSDVDAEDIKSVVYHFAQGVYAITFKNGTAKRVRSIVLTDEGKTLLDSLI